MRFKVYKRGNKKVNVYSHSTRNSNRLNGNFDTIKITAETNRIPKTNLIIDSQDIIGENQQKQINYPLWAQIIEIAAYLEISEQTPADGDCGALHASRLCLKSEGLIVSTLEILNNIKIPNCKSGYRLTDDDLNCVLSG